MTDVRLSQINAEVADTGDSELRLSQLSAVAAMTPDTTFRASQVNSEVYLQPDTIFRVSHLSVEVAVTIKFPYLQDMPGHFVHSPVAGNIKPIRSLIKQTYP